MADDGTRAAPGGPDGSASAEDERVFRWTPLEFDARLAAEGLMGLEVLEDEGEVRVTKRPKKDKKERGKTDLARPKQAECDDDDQTDAISDEQVDDATQGWTKLLFDEWTLPRPVRRNLYRANMTEPTDIQRLVFRPSLTSGANIVACAETGSGKTLAFAMPVALDLCRHAHVEDATTSVKCLAILPTRELALQVRDVMAALLAGTDIRAYALIGGMSMQKQERMMKHRPEIVVATPGRLWDAIKEFNMHFQLKFLVLDEADRLVGDNAFAELCSIVEKVKAAGTQSFIYSATILNKKKDLNALFKLLKLTNPTVCVVTPKGGMVMPYDEFLQNKAFRLKDTGEACNAALPKSLTFQLVKCLDNEKELRLVVYLMEHYAGAQRGRTVIFVNSISYAYRLEPLLSLILWRDKHELRIAKSHCITLNKHSRVDYITSIHSRLKQKQRLKRLEQFTKRDRAVLICTDVASRGIDLPNIDRVVHFQPPRNASLFIHRSGRTARLRAEGNAVCICESSELETWEGLFKAIDRKLGDVEEILDCIPTKQYAKYKRLLALACDIETQEHQMSKEAMTESWLQAAAREADIALSDEESGDEASVKRSKKYKSLKAGKRALLNLRASM